MNLSRSFAGILSSSSAKKWGILNSSSAFHPLRVTCDAVVRAYGKSLKTSAKPAQDFPVEVPSPKIRSELPRPNLIPFQAKVANSVHLVGTIDTAVNLHQFSEECYASVSILVDEKVEKPAGFSQFSIPIIFRGDLAEVAACHLKKNDIIYVSGQLTGNNLLFSQKDAKENIKLIACSLNFVKEASSRNGSHFIHEEAASISGSGYMKISDNGWDELFFDPKKWFDNRELKLNGVFNIRSPDFVHAETKRALWLKGAPDWVLTRVEGLEFGIRPNITKVVSKDHLWRKLVDNPKEWWDNRACKSKPTSPDFKHKDDGEALWINSAPSWVLTMLPPLPAIEKNDALPPLPATERDD